jgi:hypothetical protein
MSESNKLTDREVRPVSGLDGVFVRTISGREYKRFQAAVRALADASEEDRNVAAVYLMVNLAACDQSGRRLWEDDQLAGTEDTPITKAKAVYSAAVDLNALGEKKAES